MCEERDETNEQCECECDCDCDVRLSELEMALELTELIVDMTDVEYSDLETASTEVFKVLENSFKKIRELK